MACEFCGGLGGEHLSRCPYSPDPSPTLECQHCGKIIAIGQKYLELDNGTIFHVDCLENYKELSDYFDCEFSINMMT